MARAPKNGRSTPRGGARKKASTTPKSLSPATPNRHKSCTSGSESAFHVGKGMKFVWTVAAHRKRWLPDTRGSWKPRFSSANGDGSIDLKIRIRIHVDCTGNSSKSLRKHSHEHIDDLVDVLPGTPERPVQELHLWSLFHSLPLGACLCYNEEYAFCR